VVRGIDQILPFLKIIFLITTKIDDLIIIHYFPNEKFKIKKKRKESGYFLKEKTNQNQIFTK
jgi:hypothetical protein